MKTVFFDVDTQLDFLYPSGALYVPGAEAIVPAIASLNRYAAAHGIPVISTMDAHAEDDPEFGQWPHHCVAATLGQRKPAATLLDRTVVIGNRSTDIAVKDAKQIVLEKQTVEALSNVNTQALLDALQAGRYVVYGVVTEICVKAAAFGLLKTGKRVELVKDAIQPLSEEAARQMLDEFRAAGGHVVSLAEVCMSPSIT